MVGIEKRKFYLLFLIFPLSLLLAQNSWRLCTRVVDGDTIILDGYEREARKKGKGLGERKEVNNDYLENKKNQRRYYA